MHVLSFVLIAFVAIEHLGIMILEMFYWDHPTGRKIFRMSPEQSAATRVLAANQGLYNGILAAGLIWALASDRFDLKLFFLAAVVVAGIYGGMTAKRSIIVTQALPAALALAAVFAAQ
jgi:putative membrane protein